MYIERIELFHTKMKLASPFRTSNGTEFDEEHIIIRIDSEGLTGWGECVAGANPFYTYETVKTAWHVLEDFLIPQIFNKSIRNIESAVKSWQNVRGHEMAKAGLESALWDLFAKSENLSLSELLGGVKEKIDVGVSIGIQPNEKELLKKVSSYLSEGYKRIKIKIAPDFDINFVSAIRKEFPNILLQVDANSSYTLENLNLFKELDNYNLLLIEQPLDYNDIYEHSKLQKEIATPICLDESINSLSDSKTAIELGSCKIINIKPGRVGGFTEAIAIHNYCMDQKIPVWHGGMLETGVGRAGNLALASLPNFSLPADISATRRYYENDVVEPEFLLNEDGTINVPSKPGIGINVNTGKLNNFSLLHKKFS